MKQISTLIADDHTLVRETWSFILNSDERFNVIAECGSGEEAVDLARQLRPDVIIMDINLPGISGIEATGLIHQHAPESKVLGVSLHTQPAYARKMIQNGASGYVTKNSSREEMFKAIIEIHEGRKYICEEIKNILSDQVINGNDTRNDVNTLSHREIEIIKQIKKGFSSKQIADNLCISFKTVEVHRYNILKKLNLKNTAALVNFINSSQLALIE